MLESAEAFPFCDARCRLLDLGNWLDQRYAVRSDDDSCADDAVRDDEDESSLS